MKETFACVFIHAGKKIGKETLLERLPLLDNGLGLFGQQQLDFPAIAGYGIAGQIAVFHKPGNVDRDQIGFDLPNLGDISRSGISGVVGEKQENVKGGLRQA